MRKIAGIDGPLILGPMAGVTDRPMRVLSHEAGAGLVSMEMISANALKHGNKKTAEMIRIDPREHPASLQIFGPDPETMAYAAEMIEPYPFDVLDINMGCPMPKIVNNGEGSALLKDPALAGRIVRAVVDAVDVPVTVKARKGWDKTHVNIVELAQRLEDCGAAAITVHGRTKTMLYSGAADWDVIAKVKQAVSVPVIANGDVDSPEAAVRCKNRSGADAVMVGRACFGDPWLFARIRAALAGQPVPELPPLRERMETALHQMELAREDKGEHIACLEARKHLAWYLRGVAYSNYYKQEISRIGTMEDVVRVVRGIQRDLR